MINSGINFPKSNVVTDEIRILVNGKTVVILGGNVKGTAKALNEGSMKLDWEVITSSVDNKREVENVWGTQIFHTNDASIKVDTLIRN